MKYLVLSIITSFVFIEICVAVEKPKVITLSDCITIAIHNSPSIRVSEEDKKKAISDYNAALAQRLFSIDGNINARQYPITAQNSLQTNISILSSSVPLNAYAENLYAKNKTIERITLGSKYYSVGMAVGVTASISLVNEKKAQMQKSAESGIKLSKFQSIKVMYDVLFNVKKAYYSLINAKEFYTLREKLLTSNADRLKITQILYNNGQRPLYDLSKAKLDYGDAQLEVLRSKNSLRTAKTELFTAMGINDPGDEINLEDVVNLPEIKLTIEELNRYGELNNPDFQIIKIQKEINKIKVAIEFAGHFPEVDIQGGVLWENGGFAKKPSEFFNTWSRSYYGNFVARIPLFSSGAVHSKVKSAESEYNKAIYKEKEVLLTMRSTIENSYSSLKELQNQVSISKLMLENAEKHSLIAKKTYEIGKGSQLELHDAYISIVNAQLGYLRAKYDYLMAIARLSSIVGLGEDTLCKK